MTIEEMKARKRELGYTNETVARLSGIPLGTVQKIFAGETKSPRYDTIQKLIKVLDDQTKEPHLYEYGTIGEESNVAESNTAYEYGGLKQLHGEPKKGQLMYKYGATIDENLRPPKKRIGFANGKYKMPPDELLFNDEIVDMFEDL